jgi:hypothetical protein
MFRSRASARRAFAGRFVGFRNAPTAAAFLLAVLSAAPAFNTSAWSDEPVSPSGAHAECQAGEEACPAVLRMRRGADIIEATGWVSGEHPNYYFKFDAKAGQQATIRVVGGNIKTGPGIPITFPDGGGDALDVDTPFTLPATGTYVIVLHANTMSSGPFGRFRMTLRID